jgi:Tol biopolymer transport system component
LALIPGTRLGVYEVTAPIGEGGMGQVYRATDTTLGRQVAIKILPDAFASDPERLARFEREAKTLASLNHPHIAAIYAVEAGPAEAGHHVRALVMELVEGEDLSEKIEGLRAKGQGLPIDEALPIAKQIADALEAAHEQGIVHRDLKPANIKVRADGTVKVLDFGLAKAMQGDGSRSAPSRDPSPLSMSPTMMSPAQMSGVGVILGTAAYMAPEQAKGRTVDKRADIWAFGVVVYEMLTGRRLFAAEDVSETLAAVLTRTVDLTALPAATPPRVQRLLARCLDRDPRMRLRDIGEARVEIEKAIAGADESAVASLPTAPATSAARGRLAWIAALAVAAVVIAAMAMPTVRHLRETLPPEMRVEITTPSTSAPLQFALSPDGRYIVFVASADGRQRLWLRPLDRTEAQPMAGTEGAEYPFWSPDSRSVGFFASTKLYRVDITGGLPQVLASNTSSNRGGTWNAEGTILFTARTVNPLLRVAASGGDSVDVTRLDPPRQLSHRFPYFLPDGRHFLFYALGLPESSGIYLGSLDGGETKRLTAADTSGAFLKPDHVVFIRQGALVARRLDLARGELTGDPVTLADPVGYDGTGPMGGFSVSSDGHVAYRAGGAGMQQLTWFDRIGKVVGVAGEPDANNLQTPELSPDGRRVAMTRTVQTNQDVWLMDLVRGGLTRLTFDPALDNDPVWSPDGMRIAFSSNIAGAFNLFTKPSNGAGAEETLLKNPNSMLTQDWSRDGRFLLYYEVNPKTGRDLWALELTGNDHKPRVVANTPFEEVLGQFSPDGRWVAYQTNESGRFEIVVQPFPAANGKWQVSTGGGVAPRWRADGKEIYFIAPDATMMAVPITASGPTFEAGTPMVLFPTRIVGGGTVSTNRPQYAVARDGRFLINQPVKEDTATPITLLMNWRPEAKK